VLKALRASISNDAIPPFWPSAWPVTPFIGRFDQIYEGSKSANRNVISTAVIRRNLLESTNHQSRFIQPFPYRGGGGTIVIGLKSMNENHR
jgi:hypothetical protein